MTEEEKKAITQLLWYKQLFEKGYCQDCNELCSSGASIPSKDLSESIKIILNLIQKLQEENRRIKKEYYYLINRIEDRIDKFDYEFNKAKRKNDNDRADYYWDLIINFKKLLESEENKEDN